MKPFSSILLAASSILCLGFGATAMASTRPHYGGTLHVGLRETAEVLDPASLVASGCRNLSRLIFEPLLAIDGQGRLQPLLATSWQSEPGNQRWRVILRRRVSFHDGAPLDAGAVAASLRSHNPDWKVLAAGEAIVIETQTPDPWLPQELALARNAISRGGREHPSGTGPFAIADWVAGKRLRLNANEQYWASRPFLDSIEVQFGLSDRDQLTALDLGRLDLAEVAPSNLPRARRENRIILESQPIELMALVFARQPRSEEDTHTRSALARALNTSAMNDVLLQGEGEASGALLPNWISGYAFLFRPATDPEQQSQPRSESQALAPLRLAYDGSDPLARLIAERGLLNARDVGIKLELTTSANADVVLRRISLACPEPQLALTELARGFELPRPQIADVSIADLYEAENRLLQSRRVIPLLHLRAAITVRPNVRGEGMLADGTWQLTDAWLAGEKP